MTIESIQHQVKTRLQQKKQLAEQYEVAVEERNQREMKRIGTEENKIKMEISQLFNQYDAIDNLSESRTYFGKKYKEFQFHDSIESRRMKRIVTLWRERNALKKENYPSFL